jgi:uncharacterized protein (TIGR02001 family)
MSLNTTFREPELKKKSVLVTSFLSLGAAGAFAQATPAPAAPEPAFPLTANINVTTKYKFRGQDQGGVTLGDDGRPRTDWLTPAVQGGFDWSANGFYVGNWNSNIGFTNQGIEMDFYGGYKGEITKDFGFDVGILQYYYPQKDKSVNFDTTELYAALSWTFLTLKYSHTISNDYFGIGKSQSLLGATPKPKGQNTGYIELNANFPLMDKLTLNGHIGYTNLAKDLNNATVDGGEGGTLSVGAKDYTDYKIGVTYDMSAFAGSGTSAAIAYVGANKKGFYGDINKGQVILTLSKAL